MDIDTVDAVVISHDHADHVRCAGVYQRQLHVPLYVTQPTLAAAARRGILGPLDDVRHFSAGRKLTFDGLAVETIPTPHDGQDGVVFVVDDGRRRLGILTDLGHAFDGLAETIASLDALLLESNHDVGLLENGPYPWFLKERISGPGGHISNDDAAGLLAEAAGRKLKWICLAHLSEQNNEPDLAEETHRDLLGSKIPIHVAGRYEATEVLKV